MMKNPALLAATRESAANPFPRKIDGGALPRRRYGMLCCALAALSWASVLHGAVNVVTYWRLGETELGATNGGSPTTIVNTSGGNFLTVVGGPKWTNAVSSSAAQRVESLLALSLSGANYATGAVPTVVTDNFGMEAWVRSYSLSGQDIIVHNGHTGNNGWGLIRNNNTYGALLGGRSLFGSVPATIGTWEHLALVRTNGTSVLFRNGTAVATDTNAPVVPSGAFAIGITPQFPSQYFDGEVDELRVFTFTPGQFSTNDLLLNKPLLAPSVSAQSAGYVTTSSARLSAAVNPQDRSTRVWIEFGTTTNYGNVVLDTTLPAVNGSFSPSAGLAGLPSETLFHFRAVASNSVGVTYGANQTFTTRAVTEQGPGYNLSFNGVNGYLTTSLLVSNPQMFTLSLWFKAITGNGGKLIGFGSSSNGLSTFHDRAIYLNTNGAVFAGVHDGTAVRTAVGTTPINNGIWHHVACTFSPTNGLRLYVDGSLAATNLVATNAFVTNGYWRMGWDAGWLPNPQPYLDARVDEVQIWNTVRTPQEIAQQSTLPLTGNEPGLVEYWRFSEGSGTTTADAALAQGNNVAIFNGSISWQPSTRPYLAIPLVAPVPVTDVRTNSITLNGTVNPNSSATAAWFEYGLTTNYTGFTSATALTSTNIALAVSNLITGLAPATTYHFRIVATNASGLGYSADQTFTTDILPPAVVTAPPGALTTNGAMLRGTVNPYLGATLAWFEYGFTTSYGTATDPIALSPTNGILAVSNTIAGLAPGTPYHYRLVASNAAGITFGNNLAFNTAITTPEATTLAATDVTGNSARLNASINPFGGQTTVWFEYGFTTNYGTLTVGVTLVGTNAVIAFNRLVGALTAEATYQFRVIASNAAGVTRGGNQSFATPSSAPAVFTFSASAVSTNSATLNGTVNPNLRATFAWFEYGTTTNYGTATTGTALAGTDATLAVSEAITGLAPGTPYHFRLVASNDVGVAYGVDRVFVTVFTRPEAATLPATDVTLSTAALNASVNPFGGFTTVWFQYGTTTNYGSVSATVTLPLTNAVLLTNRLITGLSPETTYHFRVVASNAAGIAIGQNQSFITTVPWRMTLPITGLSNDVATLNGRVNPQGHPALAWFEWGVAPSLAEQTPPVDVGDGTDWITVSDSISELLPGETVFARFVVSNANGLARGASVKLSSPTLTMVDPFTTNMVECRLSNSVLATATNVPLEIAAGEIHGLMLRGNGTVAGWGAQSGGAGTNFGEAIIPANTTNVVSVAAGLFQSMAVRANGSVVCWGNPSFNRLIVPASATNVIAAAAGGSFNLVLRSNGTVVAWGDNTYGQINVPATATNVVAIRAGIEHSVALRSDGSVIAWGNPGSAVTTVPAGAVGVVALAAGHQFSLALRGDGTVVAWGNNNYNQTNAPFALRDAIAIAAGANHGMALRPNGVVVCWGANYAGQSIVPIAASNIVAISASGNTSFALRADGAVIVWGQTSQGQSLVPATLQALPVYLTSFATNAAGVQPVVLSSSNILGGLTSSNRFVNVVDSLPPVVTLIGGSTITNILYGPAIDPGATASDLCGGSLTITTNSNVDVNTVGLYSISYTATDSSGNAATNTRVVRVLAFAPTVATLPPSLSNSTLSLRAFVTPNGPLASAWFEWGPTVGSLSNRTSVAEVGIGGTINLFASPLAGFTPGTTISYRVVASNSLGVVNGVAQTFSLPQLALNGADVLTNECHFPFSDPGVTDSQALKQLACGWNHILALRQGGVVHAWGGGTFNSGAPHYGQSIIPAGLTNLIAIAAGGFHSLAVRADRTVVAWGFNQAGQTNVPAHATNVVAVAAGYSHNVALRADGSVITWGTPFVRTNVPVAATNVVAISASMSHTLALRADGTIVAWGDNFSGEANVPAISNAVAIAAGDSFSIALLSNGTLTAWGNNSSGQTTIPPSATNIVSISAGRTFTLARRANGTVVAWGANTQSQLAVPPPLTNAVAIAAGGDGHCHAVLPTGAIANWGGNAYGESVVPPGLIFSSQPNVGGDVDFNIPGTYTLTYNVSNPQNVVASITRSVVVVDRLAPTVALNGPALVILTSNTPPWIDPGATGTDLCAGSIPAVEDSHVNFNVPGSYFVDYIATDASGNSATNKRNVVIAYSTFAPPTVPGDTNGDNIVSQAELAAVLANLNGNGIVTPSDLGLILSNYWPNSPWLAMTNVAGLGGTNVTFALPGAPEAPFRVEATTNFIDWENLGPLTPRYEFNDTNAPALPARHYRLRWP